MTHPQIWVVEWTQFDGVRDGVTAFVSKDHAESHAHHLQSLDEREDLARLKPFVHEYQPKVYKYVLDMEGDV